MIFRRCRADALSKSMPLNVIFNCAGMSAVVTGDVADLSTIGFDKKIVSIRFGD